MNNRISSSAKIKSRKDFNEIYTHGKTIYSSDKKWKAVLTIEFNSDEPAVRFAGVVHKRSGTAVWRNRIKRLLRESYRLNKDILAETIKRKNLLIKIVFSPNFINQKENKIIGINDILPGVTDILNKICKTGLISIEN